MTRRRRSVAVALIPALIFIACGDDDALEPADPDTLTTCEQVADQAGLVLEGVIELVDALSPTEQSFLVAGGVPPPQFRELETRGRAVVARGDDLGCDPEEMTQMLADRAERLTAESGLGGLILSDVRTGNAQFFGL